MEDTGVILLDGPLELAAEDIVRGVEAGSISDENIRLLLTKSRVTLSKGETETAPATEPGQTLFLVPLVLTLQPHPQCEIPWALLRVSLTGGGVVLDVAPDLIESGPVEMTVKWSMGAELTKVVKATAAVEGTEKWSRYMPRIVGGGEQTAAATWTFEQDATRKLAAGHRLHLLVRAPGDQALQARVEIEARVQFEGVRFVGRSPATSTFTILN